MEAILFAAARSDHVEEVIRPALQQGTIVLCDRFMDSSRVYQGVTGNLNGLRRDHGTRCVNGVIPDCTIISIFPPRRVGARPPPPQTTVPTDLKRNKLATHEKRREAFLDIAGPIRSDAASSMPNRPPTRDRCRSIESRRGAIAA